MTDRGKVKSMCRDTGPGNDWNLLRRLWNVPPSSAPIGLQYNHDEWQLKEQQDVDSFREKYLDNPKVKSRDKNNSSRDFWSLSEVYSQVQQTLNTVQLLVQLTYHSCQRTVHLIQHVWLSKIKINVDWQKMKYKTIINK